MSLPEILPNGFLPPGVHSATLLTQRDVFTSERARLLFEADIFWATEAIGTEELDSWLGVYQYSLEMVQRGIVEILFDD